MVCHQLKDPVLSLKRWHLDPEDLGTTALLWGFLRSPLELLPNPLIPDVHLFLHPVVHECPRILDHTSPSQSQSC